jgi:hypothetical protein
MSARSRFWSICRDASVWRRAARLGLPVGFVQVALNQGDHWLAGAVSGAVVANSILSPALSFLIAFTSAAATRAAALRSTSVS